MSKKYIQDIQDLKGGEKGGRWMKSTENKDWKWVKTEKMKRMEQRKEGEIEEKGWKMTKWVKWKMEKEKPKHMKVKSMDFWDHLRG